MQADLSRASLISNLIVDENPQLLLKKGWTLITRSGTIGRMVYAREDMADTRLQPYYFTAQVADVQTRTGSDGQPVQRVEFTDMRW